MSWSLPTTRVILHAQASWLAPQTLLAVRESILRNRLQSPLFDTAAFTRDLKKIYARVCELQRRSIRKPLVVADDAPRFASNASIACCQLGGPDCDCCASSAQMPLERH